MLELTSAELTAMRTAVEDLLPDTCNILESTLTADGQGGNTEAWGTLSGGTAVDCRLDSKTAAEGVAGGELQPYHAYILTLPNGTTITTDNRVEVGSNTFNVTSVDKEKSWSACVRAWLSRV